MSELVNARTNGTDFRWQLLATVSAIALIGFAHGTGEAKAADDDGDRPTVWIELGSQLSRLDDGQEVFAPSVMDSRPSIFSPSQDFEKPSAFSIDETGKISFQPEGSDWVLSASVRYGRSSGDRHVHQQTNPEPNLVHFTLPRTTHPIVVNFTQHPIAARFADTIVQNGESHSVLDFQAGKDVGLGMFGSKGGSSIFNVGVRFAQFNTRSSIALKSDPDFFRTYRYRSYPQYNIAPIKIVHGSGYHSNAASLSATRSFHGIGPSLSWNASAPLLGNPQNSELTFDWDLNAAVLFGRQRASVHHQMTEHYHPAMGYAPSGGYWRYCHGCHETIAQPSPVNLTRSHTVIVPNVGGFAGMSFIYSHAKVSFGYRADLFFGAMDGGIDARKTEIVGFYGPFASVSVGIGG